VQSTAWVKTFGIAGMNFRQAGCPSCEVPDVQPAVSTQRGHWGLMTLSAQIGYHAKAENGEF